ncbi:MAG: hypothetical protein R3B13_35725 [Polyangiaceae bacterium]
MTKGNVFLALGAFLLVACGGSNEQDPQTQNQPPPGYYQQPQPQYAPAPAQPAPMAQPAPAPAPVPATTGAPTDPNAAPAATGTPTAIPGVMKNADGTCSLTVPGAPQPMVGPCPPGI